MNHFEKTHKAGNTYSNRVPSNVKNTYKTEKTPNTFWKKAKLCALGTLMLYVGANAVQTARLSKAIEPLSTEFHEVVNSTQERDFAFNYGGTLEELATKKNQFAKDNNAHALPWMSRIRSVDQQNVASTPTPLSYNPVNILKPINKSAIYK